jgi:hypothetical protein
MSYQEGRGAGVFLDVDAKSSYASIAKVATSGIIAPMCRPGADANALA